VVVQLDVRNWSHKGKANQVDEHHEACALDHEYGERVHLDYMIIHFGIELNYEGVQVSGTGRDKIVLRLHHFDVLVKTFGLLTLIKMVDVATNDLFEAQRNDSLKSLGLACSFWFLEQGLFVNEKIVVCLSALLIHSF
jgi:hypothetical protein